MKYAQPEILVTSAATNSIAKFDGTGGGKGSTTCVDSSSPDTSNGAYEVDE